MLGLSVLEAFECAPTIYRRHVRIRVEEAVSHFGPSDTLAWDTMAISFRPKGHYGQTQFGPKDISARKTLGPKGHFGPRQFGPKDVSA